MSRITTPPVTVIRLNDVSVATQPLAEQAYRDGIADRLRSLGSRHGSRHRSPSPGQLEAWAPSSSKLVRNVDCHPLVAALRLAYAEHRPLRLSPDTIWLAIAQGAAEHIRVHAEKLRSQFVRHPGQAELAITVDSERFHKGSPENPWPEALEMFSQRIREHIGEKHDWFVPDFSTTRPAEKAASEIVLMDALEPYFRFKMTRVICGIPTIELEGTPDDWRSLADRTRRFRELDLAWWLDPLHGILEQFYAAAAGKVDGGFWRSIYRTYQPEEPCSPRSALGWFTLLFPYLSAGARGGDRQRNPWLTGERTMGEMWDPERTVGQLGGRRESFVFESALPTGLSRVPFQWHDQSPAGETVRRFSLEFLAGYVGIRQDLATLCLRPEIGWAVREVSSGAGTP